MRPGARARRGGNASGGCRFAGTPSSPGSPRRPSPRPRPPGRWGQGHKRGQQQEAVVTGLDPMAPSPRPPQAGVGTGGPGGAAGGPDPRRHHGLGGRGDRAHLDGGATPGGAAAGRLLPTPPAVQARRRISGAWWADRDRGRGRRLWASGEGSPGAVRKAWEERRGAGGARPAGRAAQRAWGALWAGSSATATSPTLWPLCAGAGAGGRSAAGAGGVINPPSTDSGHTPTI